MIKLKTAAEIETLKAGGQILAKVVAKVAAAVKPGVKTRDLDDLARQLIAEAGGEPSFLNHRPAGSLLAYPAALCVSVNEAIVHGVPSARELKAGDLVTVDLGLKYQDLFTDHAVTVVVGKGRDDDYRLLEATRVALEAGIGAAVVGNTTGDIGAAIMAVAKKAGFAVIRDLSGHGVGHRVHEEPFVPNFGKKGTGTKLEPGLVIAIEPMLSAGKTTDSLLGEDGFTLVTADQARAAHFEHTVAITTAGPVVLTAL